MERLTYRDVYGGVTIPFSIVQALDKLAAYEDAEEEGRLIVLPCKIGDTLFTLTQADVNNRDKLMVKESVVKKLKYITIEVDDLYGGRAVYQIGRKSIGKTVFLTRAEAEAALQKIGGADNV